MKQGSNEAMKQVTVSAPGKLMLLGEHAVVYGYPCIVTTVDRCLTVKVRKIEAKDDKIVTPDVSNSTFVREAITVFRDKFEKKERIYLETESNLGNYGLGSSAAVTVATLKALMELFEKKTPRLWRGGGDSKKEDLFNLAYEVVKKAQGLGSGFDLAASIWGGTIYFAGEGKKVESLCQESLPLIVGYSGEKADTASMVNLVKEKRQNYKEGVEKIFENIAQLVEKAKVAILEKDWARLGTLMNYNQDYLEDLGVSTEKLNDLISASRKAGSYGAKLSGAGGGDCMTALVSKEKKRAVTKAIKAEGGKMIEVPVGTAKGIKNEE